jgi:parallel beta-helix repeat protein
LFALALAGCATAETGSSVVLNESGATVDGRVASDVAGQVHYWAQYGRTTAYGSETPHATVTVQPRTPTFVSVEIDGLARETEYHYRLCASDSQQRGGPGCGVDRTFLTERALCGKTVTTSLRLTADVSCSEDPALIVGADQIDINLAGHRLGAPFPLGIAIRNNGHSDVTIRNGTVAGGIDLNGASRNLIRGIDLSTGAIAGIDVEGGAANAVRASDVFGRQFGIRVGSDDAVVANNDADAALGPAIGVTGERARIVRNRVNRAGGPNVFAGIELSGSNGRVVDNRVSGGWLKGGIVLDAGGSNVIAENEVSDIRFADGQTDPKLGDGIVINAFTAGTLLRNNLAQRNDGDGIDVRASGARLRDNSAFDNHLLGINAVAGVTDLGGNRAHGNGNPQQCLNVACSP